MELLARFLRRYATRHIKSYAAGFLFLGATTLLTVAIPAFVELAVDAIDPMTNASGAPDTDPGDAVVLAWAIIAAGLGIMVVRTLSRVLFFNPGRAIEYQMKSDLFRHLTEMPRDYFDRMTPGEVVSRGTNDAQGVRAFIGFGSLQVFNVVLTLILTIGKMLLTDWELTLWVLLPLVVSVLVLRRAIRELFTLTRETQEALARISARSLELYGGATVLQSFGAVGMGRERFEKENTALLKVSQRIAFVIAWFLPIVDVVGNLCLVVLLFVGGGMVVSGSLTAGELAAFAVLIRLLAGGLNSLGWLVNALQRGWISLTRVYEVLDAPTRSTSDGSDPMPPAPSAEDRGRHIEVRGLDFSYPRPPDSNGGEPHRSGEPQAALSDISFSARPGATVGIFGMTGAGKSTLLDLLARVQEPPPGTIFVDGVDVRAIDLKAFRAATTYVPQEAWLFSKSLRANVALAHSDAERDDARVEEAVRAAALSDDVGVLPDGLETRVGERGIMLSGGQRQRAALARAFYKGFEILLLDDVLSAVDHATEKRLIDEIYQRRRGATTLIVSHRVSALKHADEILVLGEGRIIARGDHQSLLADTTGPYWRAWRMQQARAEEEEAQAPLAPPSPEVARG